MGGEDPTTEPSTGGKPSRLKLPFSEAGLDRKRTRRFRGLVSGKQKPLQVSRGAPEGTDARQGATRARGERSTWIMG